MLTVYCCEKKILFSNDNFFLPALLPYGKLKSLYLDEEWKVLSKSILN